jgi:hypothetical protein
MSKNYLLLFLLLVVMTSCGDSGRVPPAGSRTGTGVSLPPDTSATSADLVLIASDIVTEVIIRPDPEGDPWEVEKVAGYRGDIMVNTIFGLIYEGKLTAWDYHSGNPMKPAEVRDIEKEFSNDRSKIGKLSFTEDWYYDPSSNRIEKITKSAVFGYELYNGEGKVYAYKAAFRADLGSPDSSSPGNNP